MTETPDEPTFVPVTVTCQTDGCGNAGHEIELSIPEGGAVACGVCGNPITEVVSS